MPKFSSSIDLPAAAPAVPPAGFLRLFAYSLASRMMLKVMGPSGLDFTVQPHIMRNKMTRWSPLGNSASAPTLDGTTAVTTVGTANARNVATTNFFTRLKRLGYISAATAGSLCSMVGPALQWTIGTGAGLGGFTYLIRFGCSDAATVAGARQYAGMMNNLTAPTNVEPSTLVQHIGVGHGTADTNLKLYYGGSAAQTSIDLGVNFPANTLSVDAYELALFASPNSQDVGWRVERLNTGNVAEGVITNTTPGTTLPLNTALLAMRGWRCNNATALAVALDFVGWYIETDY